MNRNNRINSICMINLRNIVIDICQKATNLINFEEK